VLEVGTGTDGDLARFLEEETEAVGLDLSPAAVQATARRIALEGLPARVIRADVLCLPFGGDMFDLVWSWGGPRCTTLGRNGGEMCPRIPTTQPWLNMEGGIVRKGATAIQPIRSECSAHSS
jgi:Methyltransferase domain